MTRYGPVYGHPIDPVICRNGLGGACGPQDCVLEHTEPRNEIFDTRIQYAVVNLIPLSVTRADVADGVRKWLNDKHDEIILNPQLYTSRAKVDLLNDLRAEMHDAHRAGHFPWESKPDETD